MGKQLGQKLCLVGVVPELFGIEHIGRRHPFIRTEEIGIAYDNFGFVHRSEPVLQFLLQDSGVEKQWVLGGGIKQVFNDISVSGPHIENIFNVWKYLIA